MNMPSPRLVEQYQESLPVHLLRTRNAEGEHCYFVIRCSKAHFLKLIAKKGKERINITEYGEILVRGYGEMVSEHDLALLKTLHHIELSDIQEA